MAVGGLIGISGGALPVALTGPQCARLSPDCHVAAHYFWRIYVFRRRPTLGEVMFRNKFGSVDFIQRTKGLEMRPVTYTATLLQIILVLLKPHCQAHENSLASGNIFFVP